MVTFEAGVGLYAAGWLVYAAVGIVGTWLDVRQAQQGLDRLADLDRRRTS